MPTPEQKRAWRLANPDRAQAATKRWQERNHAKVRRYALTSRRRAEKRNPGGAVSRATAWNHANPERHLDLQLRSSFGITLDEYRAILSSQGGVCAICLRQETMRGRKRLAVDHCHATGRVRGLLCSRCNTAIGYLGDDPSRTARALQYLETSK